MPVTARPDCKAYSLLCKVLERNEIFYEVKKDNAVTCVVCIGDEEIRMTFTIDTSKMLVTLLAPVSIDVAPELSLDAALAVCVINDRISEGAFCCDYASRLVYFRLTQSYYNLGQTEFLFEYMLSSVASAVEKYRPGLNKILKSQC